MRRFGVTPRPEHRYTRRPGAYVVAMRDGRVLLTHQSHPYPEFQLPGGGIEPGESAIEALRRECIEETGWSLTRVHHVGLYRRFVYMPEYDLMAEKLCHVFQARAVSQKSAPTEAGHIAVWSNPQAAWHALSNDGDAHYLARVAGLNLRPKLKQRHRDIIGKPAFTRVVR